jgi:predicted nucleotidyltransferase
MRGNWYKKCMPRIKDAIPLVNSIAQNLQNVEGVKKIYAWGSFVKFNKDKNYRIKDIDILVKTDFLSEDLVSIDSSAIKIASAEKLVDEGFDPLTVNFSKKIASLYPIIDSWAISKDNKLLHWGPIFANKDESDCLKKDAEKFAESRTGIEVKKLKTSSDNKINNWYDFFHSYYSNQISDMPSGWYRSEEDNVKSIMKEVMEIK